MQFVDEQQRFALAFTDVVQDRLQPFLELPAEFGARYQRAHVQREDRLVLESLGHVAAHYPLGKPFHDRRFAYARFAYQHGVVLGLPGKDPDHVPYLGIPADDGVEFLLPGALNEVETVLRQRVVCVFGFVAGYAVRLDLFKLGGERRFRYPQRAEYRFDAVRGVIEYRQHYVLHGNVLVGLGGGKPLRVRQDLVGERRDVDFVRFPARSADGGHLGDLAVQHCDQFVGIDARFLQKSRDQSAVLVAQSV